MKTATVRLSFYDENTKTLWPLPIEYPSRAYDGVQSFAPIIAGRPCAMWQCLLMVKSPFCPKATESLFLII